MIYGELLLLQHNVPINTPILVLKHSEETDLTAHFHTVITSCARLKKIPRVSTDERPNLQSYKQY